MAKDKKEQKAQKQKAQTTIKAQAATTENVMEKIRKGNLMNEALTKQVLDDIEKEKDENKARELKRIILKASYHRLLALLQLRARRRESDITLEKLKKAELLEDQVAGFELTEDKIKKHDGKDGKLEIEIDDKKQTFELKDGESVWVPATITPNEYRDKERELNSDTRKKMIESDRQLQTEIDELRKQYPGYYCFDWDW